MADDTEASAAPRRGQHDFTQGPIAKTLVVFTLPMLGSTIL